MGTDAGAVKDVRFCSDSPSRRTTSELRRPSTPVAKYTLTSTVEFKWFGSRPPAHCANVAVALVIDEVEPIEEIHEPRVAGIVVVVG